MIAAGTALVFTAGAQLTLGYGVKILIDEGSVFERASRFMTQVMPHNSAKLKHYEDPTPLFSRFQIEHQIENAYARSVKLPSGGALVIDHTEALISVDVNSARATKGSDIEETALQTNLEAVDELARQMRIRDLGGLIVIDLIDMTSARNKKTVENRLEEALHSDRGRIQMGHISRFGLLEMSRQRLRSSISESNYRVCQLCDGTGQIRHVTSSALSFLRILEEEALKENTEAVFAELPVDTKVRLDPNQSWSVSVLRKWIDAFYEEKKIEFIEQPLPHAQIDEMFEIAIDSPIPFALDESVVALGDLHKLEKMNWNGYFIIKPSLLSDWPRTIEFIRKNPSKSVLSTVFESPFGYEALLRCCTFSSNSAGIDRKIFFGKTEEFEEHHLDRLQVPCITNRRLANLWNSL